MERLELAQLVDPSIRDVSCRNGRPRVVTGAALEKFRRDFAEAAACGGPCLLADPSWTDLEKRQLTQALENCGQPGGQRQIQQGWLGIPTGGSSGRIRWACHDQDTLCAAIRGFCAHFGVERVHSVGVLPLHHVSGLMGWLRSAVTGGRCVGWEWRRLLEGGLPPRCASSEGEFLSLVPTQLERLIDRPKLLDWLRGFRAILIGGGPAWDSLWDKAAAAKLPLCFSYGATETAAMLCAQRPGEFESGLRDCGLVMPHASVEIGADGGLLVLGGSVFRGYFPSSGAAVRSWEPGDLGRFNERGALEVLGRRDDVIITGGEKVAPPEVENTLRATKAFADVAVVGIEDARWGACVVAAYALAGRDGVDWHSVDATVRRALSPHKRPKLYVCLDTLPRNEQGKLKRAQLVSLIQAVAHDSRALHRPGETH